jgi:beta-lactam-binding protein with PASTA domain
MKFRNPQSEIHNPKSISFIIHHYLEMNTKDLTKDLTNKVKNFNAGSFFGNLWEKIKYGATEIWYFFTSKIFWVNFGKMFGIFMGCMAILFGLMYLFTRHGESSKVGNFTGKHITTAMKEASAAGLTIITSDSSYTAEEKLKNTVRKQNPEAGSPVKEGRTIYVTIWSATGIMQLLVPLKSIGDYESYSANLAAKGIKTEVIERRPDAAENNTILDILYNGQSIKEQVEKGQMRIMQGSTVQFVVSQNALQAGNDVPIPNVIGKQFGEIDVILQSLGLPLGTVTRDASVKDERSAFIVKQDPMPMEGSLIPVGTPINIVLSQDRPK